MFRPRLLNFGGQVTLGVTIAFEELRRVLVTAWGVAGDGVVWRNAFAVAVKKHGFVVWVIVLIHAVYPF